jgi:hypothetical protein
MAFETKLFMNKNSIFPRILEKIDQNIACDPPLFFLNLGTASALTYSFLQLNV